MQTRTRSLIEAVANTMSGFVMAFFIWQCIGPLMGYEVTVKDNFVITSIFTIASVLRSYLWRRFFNGKDHA